MANLLHNKYLKFEFDWADLAFASKKTLRNLNAIFIAAPREMSAERFAQLVKEYLPKDNLVMGVSKESFVLGLEDQPQFRMLKIEDIRRLVEKANASGSKHKIYTLHYSQRDITYILEKIKFAKVLLVNGSWYHGFHHRPEYYALVNRDIPFQKISPFASEAEAKRYPKRIRLESLSTKGAFSETEMMELADLASKCSYDYCGLQTGVSLGRSNGKKYRLLATAHNETVPYETYSMHFGSVREKFYSPMHDLNYYDTVHAEVALIVDAQKNKLDLGGSTLFINLLPCPTCSRMFMKTDITEFIYREDHSDGYAIKMLQSAGKKVRRLVV